MDRANNEEHHSLARRVASRMALIAVITLTACSHQPTEHRLPVTPAAFRETDPAVRQRKGPDAPVNGAWWLVFADPKLAELIGRANRDNFTVGLATARLAAARAAQQAAAAAQWPVLGLSANATREEGPLTNAASSSGSLYVVGANLSYEMDLFGRLSRATEAASNDTAEQRDLLKAAKLVVQADIAQTYFALQALDAERALLRDAAGSYRKTARLTEGMFHSGLASELAVVRIRAEAEGIAGEVLTLDQRRAELEHALAVQVGESASTFRIAPPGRSGRLPNIPPGIPGTVLVRRPDVNAARQALLAAQIRTGLAQDRWLPTLSLTAFGGYASSELGSLVSSSAAGSLLGALLSVPIFDGGRNLAGVARANAELDAVAANYAQQILIAFKDVEDQLSALRLLAKQETVLKRAVASAERTTALVTSNYQDGLASQFELLDAERVELRDRRQALLIHTSRYQATVGLIKALGGDWDSAGTESFVPSGKALVHRHKTRRAHRHVGARSAPVTSP